VICDATSGTRIGAIAKNIKEILDKHNLKVRHMEGTPENKWVLLDCGDVVAHIFNKETRNFYSLERLWSDAPVVRLTKERKRKHATKKKKSKKRKKK